MILSVGYCEDGASREWASSALRGRSPRTDSAFPSRSVPVVPGGGAVCLRIWATPALHTHAFSARLPPATCSSSALPPPELSRVDLGESAMAFPTPSPSVLSDPRFDGSIDTPSRRRQPVAEVSVRSMPSRRWSCSLKTRCWPFSASSEHPFPRSRRSAQWRHQPAESDA